MNFPEKFICATRETGDFDKHISAPYFRKAFTLASLPQKADFLISGLGFYELFINGKKITKGHLAPYISNSDHIVYFDEYDLLPYLKEGENVIGILLGNGMQNAFGGSVWDFHTAAFRSAPKTAFKFEASFEDETTLEFESDTSAKTASSPITFNDLRAGEFYDASLEIGGWALPDFDDSSWENSLHADNPRGERRICAADPLLPIRELKPVSITKQDGKFLYDFGENCSGITRLRVKGKKGQKITIDHGEWINQGKLNIRNFSHFYPDNYGQRTIYTCKGGEIEEYQPSFTYFGFQYALVDGISEEQATPELLTYIVINSALEENGGIICSDETINKLQDMCRRSTLANFLYFPTDCPHREKNGWTGDAAVSCEHTLLNLKPEKSYREWLHNIRKAMNDEGKLPGIIPTGDWGYHWGNGPCWDQVLTTLPYFTYIYRGDKAILEENAGSILRYLAYLDANLNERGLIDFGLGDWVQVSRNADRYTAPVEVTNSIMSMEICRMASYIFAVLNSDLKKAFADGLYKKLRANIRKYKINMNTMTVSGNCQTAQAMAIYYGVFEPGEKAAAFNVLLNMIAEKDNHFDVGMLGFRVLFHLLSDFGYSDLAYELITKDSYPSYTHIVKQGYNTMVEEFREDFSDFATSYNHHFLCDISGWFIKSLAGIKVNPYLDGCEEIKIAPSFVEKLDWVKGWHNIPLGKVEVEWKRSGDEILLSVKIPEGAKGEIVLLDEYVFENGQSAAKLENIENLRILSRI